MSDLEKKLKQGIEGLEDIISILYRPISNHKFDSFDWKIMHGVRYVAGRTDDLFKYYEIEDYDSEKAEWRKEVFSDFPLSVALGAYNFFLLVGLELSKDILTSSPHITKNEKMRLIAQMDLASQSFTDGSIFSTNSQKTEESSD